MKKSSISLNSLFQCCSFVMVSLLLSSASLLAQSFVLTPSSGQFSGDGGTGIVNTKDNVSVSIPEKSSWIITLPQASPKASSIAFTVLPNTASSSRSGFIKAKSGNGVLQTFTITQNATLTLTCEPHNKIFAANGGNGSINTSDFSNIWSVEKPSWINLNTAFITNTLLFNASPNTTVQPRTGVLKVMTTNGTQQSFTFTQLGLPQTTFVVTPNNGQLAAISGSGKLIPTDSSTVTILEKPSWATIIPATSKCVPFSVTANPTDQVRKGEFKVKTSNGTEKTISITQAGQNPTTFSMTPSTGLFASVGGSGKITPTDSSATTVLEKPSWVTIPASVNKSVAFVVTGNTTSQIRTGSIKVKSAVGTEKTFNITQTGVPPTVFVVTPTPVLNNVSFTSAGGNGKITPTDSSKTTIIEKPSWTTVPVTTSKAARFVVAANVAAQARTGTMKVRSANGTEKTFTIIQAGKSARLGLDLDAEETTETFSAYPNPVSDNGLLRFSKATTFKIIDLASGQIVSESNTPVSSHDISRLKTGSYIIKTTDNQVFRFLKQQ